MLGNKDAVANIAVKNLEAARKFYEGTLGLKPIHTEDEELIGRAQATCTSPET